MNKRKIKTSYDIKLKQEWDWEYISLKPEHVAGKSHMDLAVSKM